MMIRRRQLNLLYASMAPIRWMRMAKAAADRNTVSLLTGLWHPVQVVTARAQRKSFDR
jgi:hypothetical protein